MPTSSTWCREQQRRAQASLHVPQQSWVDCSWVMASSALPQLGEALMECWLMEWSARQVIKKTAATHGCSVADLRWREHPYPPLVNDQASVDVVERIAKQLVGAKGWERLPAPSMAAEDFSFLARESYYCQCNRFHTAAVIMVTRARLGSNLRGRVRLVCRGVWRRIHLSGHQERVSGLSAWTAHQQVYHG